ncbi:MAG: NUDIX hydrolase [Alphaproteobacteria bacterium]|nr:NUDIX hydrolase [Alphaproteobacteria bacterium]
MTRLPDFAAFEPADALEAGYREALVELAGHPRPTSRDTFAPGHYTASAFVLSPDGRDLLLIEHAKLARWLQPGGHVDPDDADLVAAARREVAEETGLHDLELLLPAPFDLDVHVIPARKADPEHRHFDVRYLFRALTRHIQADSDALAARWVPLEDVPSIESDESVWRAVRKLQGSRATGSPARG